MSQASEESSSDTGLDIEDQPVYALSPTVHSRDEEPTDVTASPAFQFLDEVPHTPTFHSYSVAYTVQIN